MAKEFLEKVNRMSDNQWHLSKSVNISVILALVVYGVTAVFFIAGLRGDVEQNRVDLNKHETRIEMVERATNRQAVALGRIEQSLMNIEQYLERLNSAINDTRNPPR